MKGIADIFTEQFLVLHRIYLQGVMIDQQWRKNTFIGADEDLPVSLDGQNPTLAADARIYNCNMYCADREIFVVITDYLGCLAYILGRNVVSEIDNRYSFVQGENDAFHNADILVLVTEISCQGDG